MRWLLLGCAGLSLTACATPYQEMGFAGGVQATQISSDTFQISARGNALTDPDAIQRYALRKAAEQTLYSGFDLFLVGGQSDRSSSGGWQTMKPGETLMVKMLKYPAPQELPPGMFDARDVLKFLAAPTAPKPATADSKQCSTTPAGVVECK